MSAPPPPTRIETYEDFIKVHALLLTASGLPHTLHRRLFQKLLSDTFDGGPHFQIEPVSNGLQCRLVLNSDEDMGPNSDVFLVDHAWTFRLTEAPKQLREVDGLAERMVSIMCVDADLDSEEREVVSEDNVKRSVEEVLESEISEANGDVKWLELEELCVDDVTLSSLDLSAKCPGLIALSLCGNKIDDVEVLVEEVGKLKNIRALWVDNNPVVENCGNELGDRILRELPNLEIYNSKFTPNFGEWALGFCGGVFDKENLGSFDLPDCPLQQVTDLDLSDRCTQNLINKV